jgi:hypothetical protein
MACLQCFGRNFGKCAAGAIALRLVEKTQNGICAKQFPSTHKRCRSSHMGGNRWARFVIGAAPWPNQRRKHLISFMSDAAREQRSGRSLRSVTIGLRLLRGPVPQSPLTERLWRVSSGRVWKIFRAPSLIASSASPLAVHGATRDHETCICRSPPFVRSDRSQLLSGIPFKSIGPSLVVLRGRFTLSPQGSY